MSQSSFYQGSNNNNFSFWRDERGGFERLTPLAAIPEEVSGEQVQPMYETGGMLSEMFNFSRVATGTLENQVSDYYRLQRQAQQPILAAQDFFGNKIDLVAGGIEYFEEEKPEISTNSMQLSSSSPLHKLPTNPSNSSHLQFTWLPNNSSSSVNEYVGDIGGGSIMENQGLSLSLSSSMQQLEVSKVEGLRMGNGGLVFHDRELGASSSTSYGSKNLGTNFQRLHLQGIVDDQNRQVHVGYGTTLGAVSGGLRNSRYAKAAQELLEEFCCVGNEQYYKSPRQGRHNINPNSNRSDDGRKFGSSSSMKDLPPLSAADKIDFQRKKIKLLSMLDEACILSITLLS